MNGRVWVCLALLGLRYVFSCCCSSCCCFFFLPFFLQFSIIFAFACCSCCFCCCCIVRFSRHFPLLLWRNQFIAQRCCCCCFGSALLLPPPPLLPSPFSFLPRHITHVFYWPLATPTAAHLPLPHPTNRLSHLTLCVFSIAMPFNFLARPTTLRKPPGQPHLLQPPPFPFALLPLAALLLCCIPWLAVLCHLWLRLQLSKFLT